MLEQSAPAESGSHVLYCGFDGTLVDSLRDVLNPAGHTVEVAESATAVLANLSSRPFDLVILDVTTNGFGGLAILETVRADPNLRDIAAVVLSHGEGKVQSSYGSGADMHLTKPLDPLQVLRWLSH